MADWIHKLIITSMLGVIAFFLVGTCTRLARVETELIQVRIDIARMQILSEDDVRKIVEYEWIKLGKQP